MKNLFRAVLAVSLVIFVWYLAADRHTPFTSNARVKAIVTPIVPKVSGTVVDVPISNSTYVQPGDLLAKIDSRPFEINLLRASSLKSESMGFPRGGICDSPNVEVDHGQIAITGYSGACCRSG